MTINWQATQNFITEKTDTAHNVVVDVFQNAKNSLSDFGTNTTIDPVKNPVFDSIIKAESISQGVVEAVQTAINNTIQNWINDHPKISWLINHPLASLILLVIFIACLFGLFQAMGSLIKDAWLLILTSPFKLFKSSLQWSFQSLFKTGKSSQTSLSLQPKILSISPVVPASVNIEHQERLTKICQRLDEIHQEEHQLLEELKTIVGKP